MDLISHVLCSDDATIDTSIQLHQKLMLDMGEPLANPTSYRKLVDALIYLTILRDIAYVVHDVSQLVQDPNSFHYATLFRIIPYL